MREQEFGEDNEEVELGATCYAVPILAGDRFAKAALSVSGPTHRMRSKRRAIIKELTRAARTISRELRLVE